MPRKFSYPSIKMYEGTGDPDDHIAQYKQRMLAVALPKEYSEATICKGFGSTLIGPALKWYINLPTRSISSFAGLSDKFVEQFASSRTLEKTSDSLYEVLQHRVEPLRDYIALEQVKKKQHAARELDSDQLPSGRMRYPNRVPKGDPVIRDPRGLIIARSQVFTSSPILTHESSFKIPRSLNKPENFRMIVQNQRSNTSIIYKAKDTKDEGQASNQKMPI
ncbi:hypothetical protein DY000_02050144 [Brassica cretica]|uniref:Retrotransposon gag domain-containing protein n=1 Tax=Brassica cretica TaxID=69181 RepID=A0ABQ7EYK4_BRACR|nr:hypothetical protein DY000_02050144 [Brassica cretica]